MTATLRSRLWLSAALLATLLFRVPPMINAGAVNSDAAVVGLQGMHLLHGEWSPLLWGTTYQASFDSLLAGLLFAIAGAKPWVLFSVPLLGMMAMVAMAFDVLRRRTSPEAAFVCTLPL